MGVECQPIGPISSMHLTATISSFYFAIAGRPACLYCLFG
jgi:hypothetical protein